jgi:hypothetical protein
MSRLEVKSECTTLVRWKVANFSTVASRNDPKKYLISNAFKLDSSDIKCCLIFEPTNRWDIKYKDYSSIYLCLEDSHENFNIKLCYKFWAENELGDKNAEYPGKNV